MVEFNSHKSRRFSFRDGISDGRWLGIFAVVTILATAAPGPASAGLLMYGANPNSKIFFSMDPLTGNTTDINIATGRAFNALAWVPDTHTLFGSDGAAKTFFTIDPAT